ncbi:transcriptional regulator, GntR family with aminotransferase domain protein [Kribbella flavida DSM 17836]|uniref:Transcriptional regulator, GntR family with aminotransferase domain protein n=1 Tax=Kribbella flavida (strain DSM 17836 / JCM 10339 / NBRC 14399) TaxID=479435 RepID=D2PQJ3_KRIFD|nr:PLP-dependent aminotransferase family protein [Kribbella flavida]ADB29180.1 transcriptional regulator, GntR family with aminotransferase domain protein [Kribbella flavida DSM 17836]
MRTTLPLTVDRAAGLALHLQLAEQVRAAVRDGRLQAGHRLPSTRDLARELGVSRAVAQAAYDQLHAEGWIVGRTGSGTYIADVVPLTPPVRQRRSRTADSSSNSPTAAASTSSSWPGRTSKGLLTLRPGIPFIGTQADAGWRRAWREVSAQTPPQGYDDPAGLPELRSALAEHVGRVRGIACGPENLVITNGTVHGFRLLLSTTLRPGDRLAVEDPGYPNAVKAAEAHHLKVVDVPVDADGLCVDTLGGLEEPDGIAAVYVTPSHQYPLGGRLPVARRNELVRWARRTGATLIEDDYDSEFRYDVAPLPALAQLDLDRVVHLGTLSKMISPSLRLGWLVASAPVVDRIACHREEASDWPGWPMQAALLAMLRDGYLDQVVRRNRRLYAERRNHTCAQLAPYGRVVGQDAGLHITLLLPDHVDDKALAAKARAAGVAIAPLADYRRTVTGSPGLVIGYATPTDEDLHKALRILVDLLERESKSTMA